MRFRHQLHILFVALATCGLAAVGDTAHAITYVNMLQIPTQTEDLSGDAHSANGNRVGMFSDLYFDTSTNTFYALGDRGPGGGLLNSQTRVQKFTLDVNSGTGAISNFNIVGTSKFTSGGSNFNGLNPGLLNGNNSVLGLSHDPEGVTLGNFHTIFTADEYGPSVHEFTPGGQLLRTFTVPANLVPKQNGGTVNYVDGRTTIVTGRQDNRGYEGLTISPDGSKLFAIMQDPLVNEGTDGDGDLLDGEGRRSRNLRIVQYSTASGEPTAQYIYQLEALSDINGRIPGAVDDFAATAQGRSIGASSITALNDKQFLVIERDNRGIGVDPATLLPVGSKRVYTIDLTGAEDFSSTSLNNTNVLPGGMDPVGKSLFLDLQAFPTLLADLVGAGLSIPEKVEGLTLGPVLSDGGRLVLIGTDNDFSVTQSGSGTQYDVWLKISDGSRLYTPIDSTAMSFSDISVANPTDLGPLPVDEYRQIPGLLFAFKLSAEEVASLNVQPQQFGVPEPSTLVLSTLGIALVAARRRRQRTSAATL